MKQFLRKLFGQRSSLRPPNTFPSHWKLTVSDLFEQLKTGERKEIGERELSWAREYERSRFPADYHFPQVGDLYEAGFDQEVSFITSWAAPYTGGGTGQLYKGERIWVDSKPGEDKPIGVYLIPVDYKILEKRMVAESDRTSGKYGSFSFYVSTKDLNENFLLVESGFTKERFI